MNKRKYRSTLGFTDLLFNLTLGFVFLFIISYLLITPKKKAENPVKPKADILITLEWDHNKSDDIDLWVKDPNENIVSFRSMATGFMHLDKDDLGVINDSEYINGTRIVIPINREVVTLRGIIPGEYIINTHVYNKDTKTITKGKIEIVRLNPYKILYTKQIEFFASGEELTIVRIKLDAKGKPQSFNFLPRKFVIPKRVSSVPLGSDFLMEGRGKK